MSRTTAVGMYPAGASVQGALDLVGNVWEWCLNEYNDPRNTVVRGDARRVVRGGSWYDARKFARCAYRSGSGPGYRNNNLGFRLLCVSHIEQAFENPSQEGPGRKCTWTTAGL